MTRVPSLSRLLLLAILPVYIAGCGSDDTPTIREDSTGVEGKRSREVEELKDRAGRMLHSDRITITSPKPWDTLVGGKFQLKGKGYSADSLLHYRLLYDSVLAVAWGDIRISPRDSVTQVPFSANLTYTCDWGGVARLDVYAVDSATREEQSVVKIPVVIPSPPKSDSVRTVYAYFPNRELGSISDCSLVFPLARDLPGDSRSLARAAVYYLLHGVTKEEEDNGYFSRLPEGLQLNSITLEEGLATLDFSHHLMQLDHSCGIDRVRAQIEQTLAQFMTVDAVVIRVNGRVWTAGR